MNFVKIILSVVGAAAIAAAFLFTTKSTSAQKPEAKQHIVKIAGMVFVPATLHVAPGDSVKWINNDIVNHAMKSTKSGDDWQSKDLPPHESWTRTFTQGATYLCPYHPTMVGEIVVDVPSSK